MIVVVVGLGDHGDHGDVPGSDDGLAGGGKKSLGWIWLSKQV